jgi:type IV pilus assembly protein PilE
MSHTSRASFLLRCAPPRARACGGGPAGFTLIELVIAVAIVGILAAIAYPSYQGYVIRARRADAQGALVSLAAAMEIYFADNNTYVGADPGAGTVAHADWAPMDSPRADRAYTLTVPTATASAYTLRAAPRGGTVVANDGYLELTSTGQRLWDRNNDNDTGDANETNWDR